MSPIGYVFLLLLPIYLAVGLVFLWIKLQQKKNRKPPFTKQFLRSPGESLRKQMDELQNQIEEALMMLIALPSLMAVVWFASGQRNSLLIFSIILIIVIYNLVKLWRKVNKNRRLRLGWEGERAIGEELNLLMLKGYRVFHDIPKEIRGNVDHVVIGPTGVYAVETKAISKDGNAKGAEAVKIAFDGKCLVFPDGRKSSDALDQAKLHAAWLKKYLLNSTGESFGVTPVVVIPGWFINRTGPSIEVFVLSGGEILTAFSKLPGQRLDPQQIQRITHQIDQLCRSVEPWKPRLKKAN